MPKSKFWITKTSDLTANEVAIVNAGLNQLEELIGERIAYYFLSNGVSHCYNIADQHKKLWAKFWARMKTRLYAARLETAHDQTET